MKKKINRIPSGVLLGIIRSYGFDVATQSAFHQCTTVPKGNARIYVAKTQKVSRVHLAGFTLQDQVGLKQISAQEAKDLRMGSVRGELDFTEDEATILEILHLACQGAKALNEMEVQTIMIPTNDKPVAVQVVA
jgi:hypothetical protein